MMTTYFNSTDYRRSDIINNLNKAGFRPLDVMVVGVTGAGKSTTLNTLFNKDVAKVGKGCDPETMSLNQYSLHNNLRFWDTPGLGDGVDQDFIHSKKMIELLHKTYQIEGNTYGWVDMVIIIIEGSNRDMGTTYRLINKLILNNIEPERVVIAINKADIAKKGRGWDNNNNQPQPLLEHFLIEQAKSVQARVKEACGLSIKQPVFYSADKGYHIREFMDVIINAMPAQRRKLILQQTA